MVQSVSPCIVKARAGAAPSGPPQKKTQMPTDADRGRLGPPRGVRGENVPGRAPRRAIERWREAEPGGVQGGLKASGLRLPYP
jgi:hypothetical protein